MPESWMRRLTAQAIAFVTGVAAGELHPLGAGQSRAAFACFAVLFLLSMWGYVRSRRGRLPVVAATLILCAATFFLGWARYSRSVTLDDPGHVSNFVSDSWDRRASVEGVGISDPEVSADRVTFTLSPIRIQPEGPGTDFRDVSGGLVEVAIRRTARELYEEYSRSVVYGWRIRVNAPLLNPPGEVNPHGFSYREFLADQGIFGVQTVTVSWGSPPPVEILDQGEGFFLKEWALAIKEKILSVYIRTIPYPQSTFLAGVTLGVRAPLDGVMCVFQGHDRWVLDECRVAGLTHVLAVSGQHVTLISGLFLVVFSIFRLPLRVQAPLIILVLFIFLIITGMPPSGMRATIMCSVTIFLMALAPGAFQSSLIFSASSAAMIILMVNPRFLVQPSFTLSFAAILSIGIISWPINRALARLRGWPFLYAAASVIFLLALGSYPLYDRIPNPGALAALLAFLAGGFVWCCRKASDTALAATCSYERLPLLVRLCVSAQAAVLIGMIFPLSSYYFGRLSLASPVANLVALPLAGLIVPLGLVAGLVGMIPGPGLFIALIINAANDCLIKVFFYVAHLSTLWFPYPFIENLTLGRLAVYYAAVALMVWHEALYIYGRDIFYKYIVNPPSPVIRRNAILLGILALAVAAGLTAGGLRRPPAIPPKILRITFFSTSFGSAAAIQDPAGRTYLVDGGLDSMDKRSNVGEKILAPFLLKQGITTVGGIVLSALGPEHSEGLATIADGFKVLRFYDPAPIPDWAAFSSTAATDSAQGFRIFLEHLNDPALLASKHKPHVRRLYDAYAQLSVTMARHGVPRIQAAPGVRVADIEDGSLPFPFRISFLGPERSGGNIKDQSAAIVVSYGEFDAVFTGDLTEHGLESLAARMIGASRADPDALLIPDHGGSPAARAPAVGRTIRPGMVVCQGGNFKLLYGMSREAKTLVDEAKTEYDATLTYYRDLFSADRVYDTSRDWAVVIESDGKKFGVKTLKGRTL